MTNPGKFHGKRKEFLNSKREMFAAGVENNQIGSVLLQILRAYFKRFPVDWPDDKEPSEEELAAVNDNDADPDGDVSLDNLSGEDYEAEVERRQQRASLIEAKKGQIKRWFLYRYMHDNNFNPRSMDTSNPFNAILLKLSGLNPNQKPRLKTPSNIWCKEAENAVLIQEEFDKVASNIDPKHRAATRAAVVTRMFRNLTAEKQQEYADIAQAEYEEALAAHEELCKGKISTKPQDRQRCISGLVRFMQPILDRVAEATGFKLACIAGGPEPAAGGRINVISMYAGTTPGPIEMNFGQAERAAYKEVILPIFGRFMRLCFTPEECRSRALVTPDAQNSLHSMTLEIPGTSFDSFGIPTRPLQPTTSAENTQADGGSGILVPESITAPPNPPASTTTSIPPPPAPILTTAPLTGVSIPNTSTPATGTVLAGVGSRDRLLADVENELAVAIAGIPGSPTTSVLITPLHSREASPATGATAHSNDLVAAGRGPPLVPTGTLAGAKRPGPDSPTCALSATKRPRHVPLEILPSNAPLWIKNAVEMLCTLPANARWQELVAAWIVHEGRHDFKGNDKLSSKHRPSVIAEWMKNARKPAWRPKYRLSAENMARDHNMWWASLQPSWRHADNEAMETEVFAGSWEGLHAYGVNGLLSVLASLFFWATTLGDPGTDTEEWDAAVSDLLWVLQQLSAVP